MEIFFDSWVRNYYGETLLYDSNGAVCGGIHPRQGRLAVFPASARRLLHPPAIAYTSEQHMVEVRGCSRDNTFVDCFRTVLVLHMGNQKSFPGIQEPENNNTPTSASQDFNGIAIHYVIGPAN